VTHSAYRLSTEVFCLPYLDGFIVYAPLKGVILAVNRAAAVILGELNQGTFAGPTEDNLALLSTLTDLGLIGDPVEEVHEDGADDGRFRPTDATLFLTGACNLRCVYCYASGGDRPRVMDWEVARAATELVADNAAFLGADSFGVSFHGGGEPTLAWDLLGRVVEHARGIGEDRGLRSRCALATNGVVAEDRARWLIANIDDLNVSIDGLRSTQDGLRPMRDGGGSFDAVMRTLRLLSQANKAFGLRMTVTRENVREIPDAIRFFCEEASPGTIHVEPVFNCGRSVTGAVLGPDVDAFLAAFRAARETAEKHGVRLYYSGARFPEVSVIFCQAAGKSFTVTTEGDVTACYEVSDRADSRSATFFFGQYDRATGTFTFDVEKLPRLRSLTVDHIPFCRHCFCRYHCAGDCPAKRLAVFEDGQPDAVSGRCRITQELTRDQLVAALEKGSRTMRIASREYAVSRGES
jgi:uncharacterized protein